MLLPLQQVGDVDGNESVDDDGGEAASDDGAVPHDYGWGKNVAIVMAPVMRVIEPIIAILHFYGQRDRWIVARVNRGGRRSCLR